MRLNDKQFDRAWFNDREGLVEWMKDALRNDLPEQVKYFDDGTLCEAVDNSINYAFKYNCQTMEELYSFVSIMFATTPSFAQQPKIARILQKRDLTMSKKLDMIVNDNNLVTKDDWQDALENYYDDKIWFPDLDVEEEYK